MENQIKTITKSFDVFQDGGIYINLLKLYFAYFEEVPNLLLVQNVHTEAIKKMIYSEMKNEIIGENYYQEYDGKTKKNQYNDHFILFKNGLFLNFYENNIYILFQLKEEELAIKLQQRFITFIKRKKRTKEISLIVGGNRLYTKEINIKKPNVNIDLHYNDDFKEVHKTVLKTLKKSSTKGLYLFHGTPGTGKSTYIKHLILQLNKKVIFLSPKIAANLDNMSFTEFLIDNPNIVLVIEDAEDLIVSRDSNQNSQLSFLLNLTDGLIADSLGIQIIATFNTDLKNIDKALLRKGRLTAIYEFEALQFTKANKLLNHLNINNFETMKPMTLADIFNYKENNFNLKKEKIKIGF